MRSSPPSLHFSARRPQTEAKAHSDWMIGIGGGDQNRTGELEIELLQSPALPLGYSAERVTKRDSAPQVKRQIHRSPTSNRTKLVETAVTNARFASFHGLLAGPVSLSTMPVPLRKTRPRHERHSLK